MYKVSLQSNKCTGDDFRSREGHMDPAYGVVVWKILYRFGGEDLVIWTATNASMNRRTASEILEWRIHPIYDTALIDILFEIYQNCIAKRNKCLNICYVQFSENV